MLKLRRVSKNDCKLIWKWANDPDARAVSFSSEAISYKNHVRWFESKLKDAGCFFYIAENKNQKPVGQVRFELEGDNATINIIIAKQYRGKGYGSFLIRMASNRFFGESDAAVIHAFVKENNEASLGAFQKAGYTNVGIMTVSEQDSNHLTLKKTDQNEI
ncbi:MAG: GNAT family N-acetyltransferase [Desulfobacterales bacterium]|jgi:RimJ/RimL family protein N-acetyltransferase